MLKLNPWIWNVLRTAFFLSIFLLRSRPHCHTTTLTRNKTREVLCCLSWVGNQPIYCHMICLFTIVSICMMEGNWWLYSFYSRKCCNGTVCNLKWWRHKRTVNCIIEVARIQKIVYIKSREREIEGEVADIVGKYKVNK
jgi:hypothetical protein